MVDKIKIRADWKPTLEWLENIKRGTDDARPLFIALVPRIQTFVADEFSGANPNKWPILNPKYRQWKAKKGYPHWVGVLSGKLRTAAGPNAITSISKTELRWELNYNIPVSPKGAPYSFYFDGGTRKMPPREIFKSSVRRINSLLKQDIKDMEGNNKMAFTFAWLEKAIEGNRAKPRTGK